VKLARDKICDECSTREVKNWVKSFADSHGYKIGIDFPDEKSDFSVCKTKKMVSQRKRVNKKNKYPHWESGFEKALPREE
jgi:hypothetical protein